ncbi:MAG: type I restriction-modification system subunit M [Alphaproteobacteria bacterium]|nr:type I restriction-modification system subunit M [Alphaproteobacteria bacterium]
MAKITKLAKDGAGLGIEQKLWAAADKMRGSIDAAEYKHVALGLLFLKYISDRFVRKWESLPTPEEQEDRDEYIAENIFWVPQIARWPYLRNNATSPVIGKMIDEAMIAIEKENPKLRGVLPKDYARPSLDKTMLGGLINIFSDLDLYADEEQDVLGRVYEYFLKMFARAEGKLGGEFYTPRSIVRLLVEMIEPYQGRVYDPCCGSGGMFVQAEKFITEHSGRVSDISIYGQEKNATTWRLCNMNLAIRGIAANLGGTHADTFHNDLHRDTRADFILANPPFNISDWGLERIRDDARWKYGVPPAGNANYGWIQHMIHHLAPRGVIGLVLANGSMSSATGGEGEIRERLIREGLIDCMVALPPQLFYSVTIPVCLWFIRRGRQPGAPTLFIDARKLGYMATRTNRDFTDGDIQKITDAYHNWRKGKDYKDMPGFCKSAELEEIEKNGFVLTPGRYVGAEETMEDDATFEEKMSALIPELNVQIQRIAQLDTEIIKQLACLASNIIVKDALKSPQVQKAMKDIEEISSKICFNNGYEKETIQEKENIMTGNTLNKFHKNNAWTGLLDVIKNGTDLSNRENITKELFESWNRLVISTLKCVDVNYDTNYAKEYELDQLTNMPSENTISTYKAIIKQAIEKLKEIAKRISNE